MNNRRQPERWESVLLAGVMAAAGNLFLLDKLSVPVSSNIFSLGVFLHSGPGLLDPAGIIVWLAHNSNAEGQPTARTLKDDHNE
jgi:hypothetical protein